MNGDYLKTMDDGANASRVESGKRSSSVYSVAPLCKYYDVSLDEFFMDIDIIFVPVGIAN